MVTAIGLEKILVGGAIALAAAVAIAGVA